MQATAERSDVRAEQYLERVRGILDEVRAAAAETEANRCLPQRIVEQMQQRTGVPGIAVAVVHNDKVVYSHGFGVRSVTTKEPVTTDTVFQLASVSKPLGAAVVAAAVGKGKLKWEDPVRKFLPDFKLSDRYVTRKATVADMYSHRSGLPGLVGNELESYGFSRNTIIKRLRYAPLSPFRISYSYSNFGLTTGGEAAAEAAGTTWEKLADKMIFNPLGMKHTSYRHKDYVARKNRATLHQQSGSGTWITSEREPDAQAPAGGASSTVLDMAKWLRMELATGKFDGKRVVVSGSGNQAILKSPNNTYIVHAGDKLGDYRVASVDTKQVVFTFKDKSFKMKLEEEFGGIGTPAGGSSGKKK